jgi:hypothetical protein
MRSSGHAAVGVLSADICCALTQAMQHAAAEDARTSSRAPSTEVAADGSSAAKKVAEASVVAGQERDADALEVTIKEFHLAASTSCKCLVMP